MGRPAHHQSTSNDIVVEGAANDALGRIQARLSIRQFTGLLSGLVDGESPYCFNHDVDSAKRSRLPNGMVCPLVLNVDGVDTEIMVLLKEDGTWEAVAEVDVF